MDVIYLLKVISRRKWTIIFSTLIGITGALAFVLFRTKQYASNAQYSTGLAQTQRVSLQSNEITDFNAIEFRLNNLVETFKSPIVLGMVSYDLLLHDLESAHPFRVLTEKDKKDSVFRKLDMVRTKDILKEKVDNLQLLTTYDPEQKRIWDLLKLYEYNEASMVTNLAVERVPKTDYLSVSFSSENPELSAYVVNALGVKFKEFYTSLTSTYTKQSLFMLDSLRENKRREVDDLRKKLQDFRAKIGTPNPGDAATAAMTGYQELTTQLTQHEATLNDLRQKRSSVIDQLAALNASSASQNTAANPPSNVADEILELRKTNESLATQLAQKGGNDPDIQSKIDANLNKLLQLRANAPAANNSVKLQDKKDALIKERLDLEDQITSTNENMELYRKRVEEFRKTAFSGGGDEVVANAYENDLNTAQKDLDKYNSSLFASQDINVNPDFNFKPIILGQPAIKPEPAHGVLIISIAGLSMFFLSCLFIIIFELVDPSMRTPSIFQRETKLDILSVVGEIDLQRKTLKEYFDFDAAGDRNRSSNTFIEHLRQLRYQIEQSGKKIILFTSPKPGEGKSLLLESLAYTFSMSKKKLLLIDANFSDNTLTREFAAKPTLESFSMNGAENAMDKIWGITTLTSITNTDIVGCNEGNYTPSEILSKNNLLDNLEKVIHHYDFIFIEAASLNDHADGKEIAAHVQGIIAIFSAKKAIGEVDKESLKFLKQSGDKFIGAVLNDVNPENLEL
jgi:polysaccharide biosynthesis transport protein